MPYSTGLPYPGKYRYFIDPADPRCAILQEFAHPHPRGYKTISKMRFKDAHVKSVLFHGNFTLTTTDDNKIYSGIVCDDGTRMYNALLLSGLYREQILMVSGCHVIVSQCNNPLVTSPDIVLYYDREYNVCIKSDGEFRVADVWPSIVLAHHSPKTLITLV